MINVFHLRDTDKICGPGKTILETITSIDKDRFNLSVGIFLLNKERKNAYLDEAKKRNIAAIPIRTRHQFDPSILLKLSKLVRNQRIDILHSHEYKSDLIGFIISKLNRIPIITTTHGWITNNSKSRFYVKFQKKILPYFDAIIAVSSKIKKELREVGVPKDKIQLVYNAIVTEKYEPFKSSQNQLKTRFGLPKDAILIGNIGRLSPEKGQGDFLLAAKNILNFPKAYFLLIGEGPDYAKLKRLAADLQMSKRVIFTGHVKDVRSIYQDIDIVALTSYTEGFPNVILESLCMEKPVLATNVGGVNEIIEDRITGILVSPGSPDSISRGLNYLLTNPQNACDMAINGKNLVYRKFQFKDRVKKVENLYIDVYKRHKGEGEILLKPC